ncbi:coiled-coil domain-containing protein 170 isoform X5 [Ursus maritimus]|uniref:Coiled-coil domain-containing protein 170 isoform X5 n=1 Tax=Ursus maritimus TaxID=29073 RepID=A0A384CFL3_URSMA|nr:coiled-coil domain-containing protein 170 isoform X5 [Ursus maritimus]
MVWMRRILGSIFKTPGLQRMLCVSSCFVQLHRKDCLKLFFIFCLLGDCCQEIYDRPLEVPVTREQLNHYRNVAENARSELAATLVKFECSQSELRDLRSKMLSKEAFCQELKAEMENYKENNARKSSLLTSLRDRVQELEEESAALTASKIRAEITAHTATKENQELKKKVAELDENVQKCLKENEENKNQVSKNCRKHEEFLAQLGDCLDPEKKNEKASDEDLILKLRELCEENALVKGQIVTLEETINVHEMEAKASRETIMRLVSEVNREQKKAASCTEEKDRLNQDLLCAVETKEVLEREVRILQERLLAGQRVWDASKRELSLLKKSSCELEKSLEANLDAAAASRSQLSLFREKVAALLRGSWGTTGPTEDAILERIREVTSQEESRKRYLKFLDQLSEKMKLDQMAAELGFDMRLDVVLARTEQLVRLESNAVIENKTIAHNLQRKLRTQQERLESKELHMSLLRQKIAQLEEERQVRSALVVERDEANLTLRKLQKKVERLQKELRVCREANTELKAKLADTSELKIKSLEHTKAIEDLNKSRDKLEKMKEKAEKKLMSVKSELNTAEHETQEDKERARNMMEVVTSETKTLKKSLEEAETREKQTVTWMVTNESHLPVLMPLYSPWAWPCNLLWAMGHQQGWCKQKCDEHLHCGVCLLGTQMPCKEDRICMVFLERDPKITWRVRQSHPSVLVESNLSQFFS